MRTFNSAFGFLPSFFTGHQPAALRQTCIATAHNPWRMKAKPSIIGS